MFKFRKILPKDDVDATPIDQVMQTHRIRECITSGYFIEEIDKPQWHTIETIYDDAEYDKAMGYSIPEPCMGKDVDNG